MRAWVIVLAVVRSLWAAPFDLNHSTWTQWLGAFTSVSGPVTAVDYPRAKAAPQMLQSYLRSIESVTQTEYDSWPQKQRLAFLINAYNAWTVHWVLLHYPITSIRKTGGIWGSPWQKKFFKLFGKSQSLDGIEHGMIRKHFKEPRIHFSLVCASKGCPALRHEAYVGERLDEQLEQSTRAFLNDASRNRYEAASHRLYLSEIFKWYGDDFVRSSGSVLGFVGPRMGVMKGADPKIIYLDYDWALNGK